MEKIKVGNAVRLIGHQEVIMNVVRIIGEDELCQVVYFDCNGVLHDATLPKECLMVVG